VLMSQLETEELFTTKEMAAAIKFSVQTLDSWRKKGVVPCIWINHIVRYRPSAVFKALRKFEGKGRVAL
jgi:hypothetical protein